WARSTVTHHDASHPAGRRVGGRLAAAGRIRPGDHRRAVHPSGPGRRRPRLPRPPGAARPRQGRIMTRRRTAADRIARGASAEVRRRAARTADWIAASPTRRGSAGRLAVVITAVAVGVLVVLHRWPWLMWPLCGWWAVKAWRAGRSEAA